MKKILFSDYDGTLDTTDSDIYKNIEYINKFRANGNLFVITTGRSWEDLNHKLQVYPFTYDYLILNHGTIILDKDNLVIDYKCLPINTSKEIITYITSLEGIERIILYDVYNKDVVLNKYLTKILIKMEDTSKSVNLAKKINSLWPGVTSYVTEKNRLIEIIPKSANKCRAVDIVVDKEGINKENIIVVGDGETDVEMIKKYNGYGIKGTLTEGISKRSCQAVWQIK